MTTSPAFKTPAFRAAYTELKAAGCPVFVNADNNGNFSIDGESGDPWIDYWSAWEREELTAILNKHGLFMEWVNPGYGAVYEA